MLKIRATEPKKENPSVEVTDVERGTVFRYGGHMGLYLRTSSGYVELNPPFAHFSNRLEPFHNYLEVDAEIVITNKE